MPECITASAVKNARDPLDLLRSEAFRESPGLLKTPLGVMDDGRIVTADLASMPHLLIYGNKGSGRTSLLRTLVTCIAVRYTPRQAGFIFFDSSHIGYRVFKELPHMALPVITSPAQLSKVLSGIAADRDRLLPEGSECHTFIVLDDFHALEEQPGIRHSLLKILAEGKKKRVHLILVADHRSDALVEDILPKVPCRICFKTDSAETAAMITGRPGAETLESPGEIIGRFYRMIVRCHASGLDMTALEASIQHLKSPRVYSPTSIIPLAENIFGPVTIKKSEETVFKDQTLPDSRTRVFHGTIPSPVIEEKTDADLTELTSVPAFKIGNATLEVYANALHIRFHTLPGQTHDISLFGAHITGLRLHEDGIFSKNGFIRFETNRPDLEDDIDMLTFRFDKKTRNICLHLLEGISDDLCLPIEKA